MSRSNSQNSRTPRRNGSKLPTSRTANTTPRDINIEMSPTPRNNDGGSREQSYREGYESPPQFMSPNSKDLYVIAEVSSMAGGSVMSEKDIVPMTDAQRGVKSRISLQTIEDNDDIISPSPGTISNVSSRPASELITRSLSRKSFTSNKGSLGYVTIYPCFIWAM